MTTRRPHPTRAINPKGERPPATATAMVPKEAPPATETKGEENGEGKCCFALDVLDELVEMIQDNAAWLRTCCESAEPVDCTQYCDALRQHLDTLGQYCDSQSPTNA